MNARIPQSKYLAFVSVTETMSGYGKPKEEHYKAYGHYCAVVFVAVSDIEKFKEQQGYRLFGGTPATLGLAGCGWPEDRKKALNKHCGFPKFNFGQYYSPDHLLFLDDVTEYGYGILTFDKVRTARDIIQGNKHHVK